MSMKMLMSQLLYENVDRNIDRLMSMDISGKIIKMKNS